MGYVLQGLLIIALVSIPVWMAVTKGREPLKWLAYSFFLWPIAFVHAFLLEETYDESWT
jgi:hypothetical protein